MKLLGFNISKDIAHIENKAQNLPKGANAFNRIFKPEQQLYRVTTNLLTYKRAVESAESILNPYRYPLYQVFKQIEIDSHLSAAVQQRKNLTMGSKFCVYSADGVINEEKSKLLRTAWFRDFLDLTLDSLFFGHSLIQFQNIIERNGQDEFKCVELVPRIYVRPEFHFVTADTAAMTGWDYLEKPFIDWTIGVGKPRDLGLYLKAAPLVIWKKDALGAWGEFTEKFGVPVIIGKTDATDHNTQYSLYNMLKHMRAGLFGVIKTDEEVIPLETNNKDAYQVFDALIQRCNSEISKLILGQTSTLEEKAFVGSAEVHERVLDGYEDSDDIFVTSVLNYQLLPLMNNLGFGLENMYIACEAEDEWSLTDKSTFDLGLINSGKYKLAPEYIKDKYNTEVEEVEVEVEEPATNVKTIKNKLDELYK